MTVLLRGEMVSYFLLVSLIKDFSMWHMIFQRIYVKFWEITLLHVPHIKHLKEDKVKHNTALMLLKCICEEIGKTNRHSDMGEHYFKATNVAALNDTPEAIEEMDKDGNNLLHLAAQLAPIHKLNVLSGAALQMQREFQEVEKFVETKYKEEKNKKQETPIMVFRREHKELRKEGEEWMKKTSDSYTITAALIITIVFAAAITVPGGSNGDTGKAVYLTRSSFIIFAVSDAISLFTSTTSLLLFLSILTARYRDEDFVNRPVTKEINTWLGKRMDFDSDSCINMSADCFIRDRCLLSSFLQHMVVESLDFVCGGLVTVSIRGFIICLLLSFGFSGERKLLEVEEDEEIILLITSLLWLHSLIGHPFLVVDWLLGLLIARYSLLFAFALLAGKIHQFFKIQVPFFLQLSRRLLSGFQLASFLVVDCGECVFRLTETTNDRRKTTHYHLLVMFLKCSSNVIVEISLFFEVQQNSRKILKAFVVQTTNNLKYVSKTLMIYFSNRQECSNTSSHV
ncbi:hypothetical protein QVD17_41345 [Tagetes erecta]|uniref:PGG domain-containing protein n=1 Tax=Tagetes erecta TaxID=13708 RepID=A0AAD8JUP6_TARER|nr:hypothetical protein QVD17_41345 [Tagetes erecta]